MAAPDLVPTYLAERWNGRLLAALHEVYRSLDLAIDTWKERSGLSCPPGCGACCEHYEPWVLPLEGLAVAAFAARGLAATVSVLEGSAGSAACVFYDPAGPLHCTVYAARPLECRLFAFSATRDKAGDVVYRLCRSMPAEDRATVRGDALRARYACLPPVMEDYSARLLALTDPPYRPLREQARSGWGAIRLIRGLAAEA